jgi:hypothetical protein
MWCAHLGGKPQGLVDCEGREMNIVLGAVRDVAAEVLGDVFRGERVVVHFTLNEMIFCALISESFQKRAASRARASQDHCGEVKVRAYRIRKLRE